MNAETCSVPSSDDLRLDPEVASLAVLDAALLAARNSLLAHLPELAHIRCDEDPLPDAETFTAELILFHIARLRSLVEYYRLFNQARRARSERWVFEDNEIF